LRIRIRKPSGTPSRFTEKGKHTVAEVQERFFVITGGPGSGKSSLIDALERAGYARTVEAGRAIIQDQVNIGGRALPWADRELFAELMLAWELRSYRMAQKHPKTVFFDRGVPDVAGYLHLSELTVPPHITAAAREFRYNRRVLIAPPWEEIFRPDRERKQDFPEAVRTYESLAATYKEFEYELVEIPRAPIEERVRFVLHIIGDRE
jgi:predicted ATPase